MISNEGIAEKVRAPSNLTNINKWGDVGTTASGSIATKCLHVNQDQCVMQVDETSSAVLVLQQASGIQDSAQRHR
jgi:hypothetical protein